MPTLQCSYNNYKYLVQFSVNSNMFPSKQKIEVEVEVVNEIHPQEVECSPESKKSSADTEATQMLQAQPQDDSKKASGSQEIQDSTIIDIGHKQTETAKTKEGIIILCI